MARGKLPVRWLTHPILTDYEVSEFGDVRRRIRARAKFAGYVLRGTIIRNGYKYYRLQDPTGKQKRYWAHRLVLETFVGPPREEKTQTAHWDGNPANNHVSNLRWVTALENVKDRIRHGKNNNGERHGKAKLTESDVLTIRREHRENGYVGFGNDMAAKYGVHRETIYGIIARKRWNHI